MALVLEIGKNRGFYVKDTKVTVERIYSPSRIQLLIHSSMPKLVEISNRMGTEILPEVYCQAGRDATKGYGDLCKIAITAPPQIKILRDNLYESQDD
jgi:hypothetical protein